MNRDFHFRDKIAVATSKLPERLVDRLQNHPWFRIDDHNGSSPLLITGENTPKHVEHSSVISLAGGGPLIALDINSDNFPESKICIPSEASLGMAVALKPLQDRFGVRAIQATVLLPVSAQSSLASIELLDNIVSASDAGTDVVEREVCQLLAIPRESLEIRCLHVPLSRGTFMSVRVELEAPCSPLEVQDAWREFSGHAWRCQLPSANEPPLIYRDEATFPQPRLKSSATLVGQLRLGPGALSGQFVVVAPDAIAHLMMLAEAMVVAGRVFW